MGWFTVSSGPSVGSSLGRWACPAEVWAGLGIVLLLLRPPPRAAPQSLSSTARGLLPPCGEEDASMNDSVLMKKLRSQDRARMGIQHT